ncbi:MAG TPA: NAD-dependent protein deacylase [Clostridiaceae bacterium]|nr:NAD-dependent protein deacylase [Clostridiaceae bacterium]
MDNLQTAINFIKNSSNIVAFTGAGASTESNIPDFRSAGGLYRENEKYKYPPEYMLSHTFFMKHTEEFFDFYKNKMIYRDARPNNCHIGLARLEEIGKLKAVITQNIDGLHQLAGSKNVLELHGSVYRNYCMKCGAAFDLDYIMDEGKPVPKCNKCGGIVKPDVVLYEEALDHDVLNKSIAFIKAADVLIVIGTSLVVYPAAGLINYYRGDKLILINKSPTPYDNVARLVIKGNAGDVMKSIINSIAV